MRNNQPLSLVGSAFSAAVLHTEVLHRLEFCVAAVADLAAGAGQKQLRLLHKFPTWLPKTGKLQAIPMILCCHLPRHVASGTKARRE